MWSETKKKLANLICDALRDRVKFFVTQYTDAHDQYGRACFVIDGKEQYSMCFYKYQVETWKIAENLKKNPEYIPKYASPYSADYESREIATENSIYADWHFFEALTEYLNQPIELSLHSTNEIIQSFALIDRRVGKRTLKKIVDLVEGRTEMVRFFYQLRCDAEGIHLPHDKATERA